MADNKLVKIKTSIDGLTTTMTLVMPDPGSDIPRLSRDLLVGWLKDSDIVYGLDMVAIDNLAEHPAYDQAVEVAHGLMPEESIPGYYEYHFDTVLEKKPVIREDGSVDYMNIKAFETVKTGDVIATYHPAVKGTGGMSVRGAIIEPRPARDLPPIGGRGFDRSEDNITYTSLIDGKIELVGSRIIISPIHEVDGDADLATGNIDFNGDVIIHGGAKDHVSIKATGNVTIHGIVEGCTIKAGKELFLLAGVKGGDATDITCGGNLTAQFIEYASVKVGGDALCAYLFKSDLQCDGKLELFGDKCSIIGGHVSAIQGMDVDNIGNDFGTITDVGVGVTDDRLKAIEALDFKIKTMQDNIAKIKQGIEAFDKMGAERGFNFKDDPRRMQLLRIKIRDEAAITGEIAKLEKMKEIISKGDKSTIRVFKSVYPGTVLAIDDHKVSIHEEQKYIEFMKTKDGVRMERLEGIVR
ncbi:MAG: DUF342 domain-containing protein [Pseudobutyrivibrio sp.]|nr:DUF342 domain-containing protein [Pseudobutyrivibrio sp.]